MTASIESQVMHGHNGIFQDQLKTMHWLVEQQKKVPGGLTLLERALATSPYANDDYDYQVRGKAKKRTKWKDAPTATPETGCPHGEVYCKNLCRSCYQRWRRTSLGRADLYDSRNMQGSVMSADESDGESYSSGDEDMTEDREMGDWEEGDELYSRRRASAKRRLPGPPIEMMRTGRVFKKPKKVPELCVQCMIRPILCRALCNGCYQKWHKARKIAQETGQPEIPCPSIAILEERAKKKAAEEAGLPYFPPESNTPAAAGGGGDGAATTSGSGGDTAATNTAEQGDGKENGGGAEGEKKEGQGEEGQGRPSEEGKKGEEEAPAPSSSSSAADAATPPAPVPTTAPTPMEEAGGEGKGKETEGAAAAAAAAEPPAQEGTI